ATTTAPTTKPISIPATGLELRLLITATFPGGRLRACVRASACGASQYTTASAGAAPGREQRRPRGPCPTPGCRPAASAADPAPRPAPRPTLPGPAPSSRAGT